MNGFDRFILNFILGLITVIVISDIMREDSVYLVTTFILCLLWFTAGALEVKYAKGKSTTE